MATIVIAGVAVYATATWLLSPRTISFPPQIAPAFLGYGLLITLSTVAIRRYYLLITFPLEFVALATFLLANANLRRLRALEWIAFSQLVMSISFLQFIHDHQGAPHGDYGPSYGSQSNSSHSSGR
jgi:hypothetical protein